LVGFSLDGGVGDDEDSHAEVVAESPLSDMICQTLQNCYAFGYCKDLDRSKSASLSLIGYLIRS
jgi:hypothetical protein